MNQKRKTKKPFGTVYTVLVTLIIAAIIGVVIYAWNVLGFSAHSVSYSTSDSGVSGILPEERDFKAGDEVVVRAGSVSRIGYEFVGWSDVNGAIANNPGTLENGAVFIMPDADVVLEPVWEAIESEEEDDDEASKSESSASGKKSNTAIYAKKDGKDYINIRSTYGYDGEVVTKVSDSDTKIEYSGKSQTVYDEDDLKNYTWYYVSIPSKDKEGWVRSDMVTEVSSGSKSSSDEESYVKSDSYDTISLYESADSDSEVRAEIDDDETALIFTGKTKDAENSSGKTVTWYYVKDSSTGISGWVEKSKIQHVSD